jgi:hypothetical protein
MAQKIIVQDGEWKEEKNRFRYARELESGNILFFPSSPFPFPRGEIDFLLAQRQGGSSARKNIAYKPDIDKVTNHVTDDPASAEKMRSVLRNYSQSVTKFLTILLSPYSKLWKLDYASFRPFQEKGRNLRLRARNDLLHCDAFPTRPLHGARILRFFTNINPTESRKWITSKPFGDLALEFGGRGVPFPASAGFSLKDRLERKMKDLLRKTGVKIPLRSPYDTFMLRMHNFLKENEEFQKTCPKDHWEFPPNSCWAVYTDLVSHAALSGQYALEQTLLIPQKALLFPEMAPVSIIERLSNRNMVDPVYLQVFTGGG